MANSKKQRRAAKAAAKAATAAAKKAAAALKKGPRGFGPLTGLGGAAALKESDIFEQVRRKIPGFGEPAAATAAAPKGGLLSPGTKAFGKGVGKAFKGKGGWLTAAVLIWEGLRIGKGLLDPKAQARRDAADKEKLMLEAEIDSDAADKVIAMYEGFEEDRRAERLRSEAREERVAGAERRTATAQRRSALTASLARAPGERMEALQNQRLAQAGVGFDQALEGLPLTNYTAYGFTG